MQFSHCGTHHGMWLTAPDKEVPRVGAQVQPACLPGGRSLAGPAFPRYPSAEGEQAEGTPLPLPVHPQRVYHLCPARKPLEVRCE